MCLLEWQVTMPCWSLKGHYSFNLHHYIHLLGLPFLTLLGTLYPDEGWIRNASALPFELMKSSVKRELFFYFLFFKGLCCLPLISLLFLVEPSSKTFIQWRTLLSQPRARNIFMPHVKYSVCIWNHMVCNKDQWLFIAYRMLMANYFLLVSVVPHTAF